MNKNEYLIDLLNEEITEIMETLIDDEFSNNELMNEITDFIAVIDILNLNKVFDKKLPLIIKDYELNNSLSKKSIKKLISKHLLKIQYYLFKANRFGISDSYNNSPTNENNVILHIKEFLYYIYMLDEVSNKNEFNIEIIYNEEKIQKKKEKVKKFTFLSIKNKRLIGNIII